MKKSILYVLLLCTFSFMSCSGGDEPIGEKAYVDLGLPSGILWCNQNETNEDDAYGLYNYNEAVSAFGTSSIPASSHWQELFDKCTATWTGKGYKLTGPNGNHIYLPAAGCREWNGDMSYAVGVGGFYWANGTFGSGYAFGIRFTQYSINTDADIYTKYLKDTGGSVRLIRYQDK